MRGAITVVVPGVPDTRCRPNDHTVSERTRLRYRRKFASEAVYPLRAARMAQERFFPIEGPVIVDLLFRWPTGRKMQDRDSLVTTCKFLQDLLEREGLIVNDRDVTYGIIEQETTRGQPEVVVTIREHQPVDPYRANRELERWLYGGVSQDERI